jgi:hypothetical protein
MSDTEWIACLSMKVENNLLSEEEAEVLAMKTKMDETMILSERIPLIQHLKDDIFALREFFALPVPPEIQAWRTMVHMLLLGFADASGGRLGSMVEVPGMGVRCRVGVWGKHDESHSSNFKEFENVV